MRLRTLAAACLVVAVLGLSYPLQEDAGDAGEKQGVEGLQQTPLDGPDVTDTVEGVGGEADNATGTLPPPPDRVGVDEPVEVDADAARYTRWSFALPLADNGTGFRFADAAGGLREKVAIAVEWIDDDGVTHDWPGEASLVLEHGDQRMERNVQADENGTVRFQVGYGRLVAGTAAGWSLGVEVEGDVLWWSPYAADGPQQALPSGAGGASVREMGTEVWIEDADEDGEPDDRDNCPWTPNAEQANLDGDLWGDACDADDDGDGWTDQAETDMGSDPRDRRSTPDDRDADGFSNDEERRADSDPDDPASVPHDPDADGYDNDVEAAAGSDPFNRASTPSDPDADGVLSLLDNCPRHSNVLQDDGDQDGIGDACDTRPEDGPDGDQDGDGVRNQDDLCRLRADPGQEDLDGDGIGDACDADRDGDGRFDGADAFPMDPLEWLDSDQDGTGDNADADDDNDGLSDTAEASVGTDARLADTDGDTYSDLDELGLGSDPIDAHDPPYLPTDVQAVAESGGVRISWVGSGDARIEGYTVWDRSNLSVVAHLPADASSTFDGDVAAHAVMYAVQPRFHGETFEPDPERSVDATVRLAATVTAPVEAGPESQAEATKTPTVAPTPVEDTPGLGVTLVVLVVAAAFLGARRR